MAAQKAVFKLFNALYEHFNNIKLLCSVCLSQIKGDYFLPPCPMSFNLFSSRRLRHRMTLSVSLFQNIPFRIVLFVTFFLFLLLLRKPVKSCQNINLYLNKHFPRRKLNHPCIVRFFGAALKKVNDGMKFILVMELCQDSLRNYIRNNPEKVPGKSQRPDDLMKTVQWALEISEGLEYIHKLGIVHRDLKLDNILVR